MRNIQHIFKALIALAGLSFAPAALAQTTLPSTTLCAAVKLADTSICLTSTTNVTNQTNFYIDSELMIATLSNGQTLAASNAYVPVTRGNRSFQPPTPHANAAVVWLGLTPDKSIVPGDNGIFYSTNLKDVGQCTLANIVYLPHIWPDLAMMRTCGSVNASGVWQWVDYTIAMNQFTANPTALQLLTTNGALPVVSGTYLITKAGVLADTLAAPTAGSQDGIVIQISSTTANAHTLTATGLFQTGTASVNLATFAAQAGAGLTLMSYNGKWIVLYSSGITFS